MSILDQIKILYEDADILAINKPAGLVVHSDGRTEEETVVDFILSKYPEIKGVGESLTLSDGRQIERPGIVHRIDRETSGVLLIAKTQKGFEALKKQFQDREMQKEYHAIVWGSFPDHKKEGTINRPIGRSRSDFRKWSAMRGARGELREAVTNYSIVGETEEFSFAKVFPKTGRTHQIRVHMRAIEHPVLCDKLYAAKKPCALGFDRTALHARRLEFENTSGERVEVVAPYPPDFEAAVSAFKFDSPKET